jgi:hypothetical protein
MVGNLRPSTLVLHHHFENPRLESLVKHLADNGKLLFMSDASDYFKHCSTCKAPIEFGSDYFLCSVSTCNRPKIGMFFCSLPCWEAHVPEARHRDAWAEPAKAPTRAEHIASMNATTTTTTSTGTVRPRIVQTETLRVAAAPRAEQEDNVLVVVSKLKRYIRERSEMNTSDTVVGPLSDHLRALCNEAIRNAARDGRKTVMDRDFAPLIGKR